MKREPWVIGNAFAHGIRILNCIFCRAIDEKDWNEEDKEMGEDNKWLVVEQVNSMCSEMMIDDAHDVMDMLQSIPRDRLCECTDCNYHHPESPRTHDYSYLKEKCDECIRNKKAKEADMDHFETI